MDENETERIERKFSDNNMIMRGLEGDIVVRRKRLTESKEREKNDKNGTDRWERNI